MTFNNFRLNYLLYIKIKNNLNLKHKTYNNKKNSFLFLLIFLFFPEIKFIRVTNLFEVTHRYKSFNLDLSLNLCVDIAHTLCSNKMQVCSRKIKCDSLFRH